MNNIEKMKTPERLSKEMLGVSNFEIEVGHKILIKEGNFSIGLGEKVGFIGRNGSGKSTLVKLIQEKYFKLEPEEKINFKGKINLNPELKMSILPQEVKLSFEGTILEYLDYCGGEYSKVFNRYMELKNKQDLNENEAIEYQEVLEKMTELNLWNFAYRREKILSRLKLNNEILNRNIQTVSGGESTKIALAGVLLSDANCWILDEPTNNLDINSINLLLEELRSFSGSVLIITHDRRILNSLQKIIEIDEELKTIRIWGGNYTFYKNKKQEEFEARIRKYEEQERKKKQLEEELKRLKQEAHRFENISRNAFQRARGAKLAKRAKVMEERIMRELEKLTEPKPPERPVFSIQAIEKETRKKILLKIDNLSYKLKDKVLFENLSFIVEKGDRILISGEVGVGKTTLLKLIVGEIKSSYGNVEMSEGIEIGYLPQTPSILNPDQKTKNYLIKEYDLDENSVMHILSKLKILNILNLAVKDLSIGEIRKIQIAAILYKNPDILILDEPTNHLDVYTIEELVQALKEYKGTIIFVSHDKSFSNDLSPNKEISLDK